ncbi:hypothetical protein [Luteibacter yeojuensis]|uniref:SMODS and SLOG-associating 2TM effector domain-containing protein n=1 Tax=Luteibacter yeojuensis TaxID=345309 RepID=A0A0F3K8R2_9GAMM|nr:hypothetical protein [Luteibacter yeojuensis]KJV27603.1 hypothetical protein VI08_17805 [Luteibacter yeojuensis]
MIPLVIGVTSHRDIADADLPVVRDKVRGFFAGLQEAFPGLPLLVLSALAEGGDQLVAEEALAIGARLVAPLPLPPDLYVNDFESAGVHATFASLSRRAEVVLLPRLMAMPRHVVGTPGAARDSQYAKAGVYIASHCHILLALWDGNDANGVGGTAQIVHYHLTGSLPGVGRRHEHLRHVLAGGDESLLYHIVCPRSDGDVADGLAPFAEGWRTADDLSFRPAMPDDFRVMFDRMAEFNDDTERHAEAIEAAPRRLHGSPCGATATIEAVFHAADWLAVQFRKRVVLALRATYTVAALMGIAFTFYAHLPGHDSLIYLFVLLFGTGGFVAMLAGRRGWHRKYLDYRALAEGLRIQSCWRRAGIAASADHEFAHDNFLQKQNIELGWIRNVMRAASLYPSTHPEEPGEASLREVIDEWVGQRGTSGQLHYYETKTAERKGLHHITETVGRISLWAGVAISVFLAVFALHLHEEAKVTLVTIMAVLSIIAAVREAYAYRKADRELMRQYCFMQRIFTAARAALDRTHDPAQQRAILLALGEAALTEHAEWTLMQRERHVEHSKL